MDPQEQERPKASLGDVQTFVEELKSRVVFENLSAMVTKCTRQCVKEYDSMYLDPQEENCVKSCYLKSFEFQNFLNQELAFLVRNL